MLLHELTLQGILSFGPDSRPLELLPLNLLIGPNGSGKSNLLEAISLLRSTAGKLTGPMRGVGGSGVTEWVWKGAKNGSAKVEAIVDYSAGPQSLRHRFEFTSKASRFELLDEAIENRNPFPGHHDPYFYYRFQHGHPALNAKGFGRREIRREDVAPDESILSQRKEPDEYPELAHLLDVYSKVRLYREWSFGRTSIFRSPQPADSPSGYLEEDFSNLGLFLNRLRGKPKAKKVIIEHLRDLYEGLDDFHVEIKGGTVELFLTEGDFTIPASRLSDGTLRYLCLLAILCDPEPPTLVGIEEPELGLHPDILPKVANLLVAASERTQLIVTTHSDVLVDCMNERPAVVVVMEKHDGKTCATRLEQSKLQTWLNDYRLGQLWIRGDLGGTRW